LITHRGDEGVLIGCKGGMTKVSASAVVKQTKWPLLGATSLAVTAFFALIGFYRQMPWRILFGSLFMYCLISAVIKLVHAMYSTPFFCDLFFKRA